MSAKLRVCTTVALENTISTKNSSHKMVLNDYFHINLRKIQKPFCNDLFFLLNRSDCMYFVRQKFVPPHKLGKLSIKQKKTRFIRNL